MALYEGPLAGTPPGPLLGRGGAPGHAGRPLGGAPWPDASVQQGRTSTLCFWGDGRVLVSVSLSFVPTPSAIFYLCSFHIFYLSLNV